MQTSMNKVTPLSTGYITYQIQFVTRDGPTKITYSIVFIEKYAPYMPEAYHAN